MGFLLLHPVGGVLIGAVQYGALRFDWVWVYYTCGRKKKSVPLMDKKHINAHRSLTHLLSEGFRLFKGMWVG